MQSFLLLTILSSVLGDILHSSISCPAPLTPSSSLPTPNCFVTKDSFILVNCSNPTAAQLLAFQGTDCSQTGSGPYRTIEFDSQLCLWELDSLVTFGCPVASTRAFIYSNLTANCSDPLSSQPISGDVSQCFPSSLFAQGSAQINCSTHLPIVNIYSSSDCTGEIKSEVNLTNGCDIGNDRLWKVSCDPQPTSAVVKAGKQTKNKKKTTEKKKKAANKKTKKNKAEPTTNNITTATTTTTTTTTNGQLTQPQTQAPQQPNDQYITFLQTETSQEEGMDFTLFTLLLLGLFFLLILIVILIFLLFRTLCKSVKPVIAISTVEIPVTTVEMPLTSSASFTTDSTGPNGSEASSETSKSEEPVVEGLPSQ